MIEQKLQSNVQPRDVSITSTGRPSIVQNAEILDRGYERLESKLHALGVDIEREAD